MLEIVPKMNKMAHGKILKTRNAKNPAKGDLSFNVVKVTII